jgi:catechol 2,3-dioxygenase-like lactoylglutathione lyase family enzyme
MNFAISNHININVSDLDRAADFYKDVMGMRVLMKGHRDAELKCGDTIFHMQAADGEKTIFDFKVEHLEIAKAKLERAGCQMLDISENFKKIYLVSDPFGMKFRLFEW